MLGQCSTVRKNHSRKYYQTHKKEQRERVRAYRSTPKGHLMHILAAAKQRCDNPKASGYSKYGGRGVHFLFSRADRARFYENWAPVVEQMWSEGITPSIDRINPDGDYTPDNTRVIDKRVNSLLGWRRAVIEFERRLELEDALEEQDICLVDGSRGNLDIPTKKIAKMFHHAKGRCNNAKDREYVRYGGRGIEYRLTKEEELHLRVKWRPIVVQMLRKGIRPSLDRIDSDGHYEVNNLRLISWTTNSLLGALSAIRKLEAELGEVCPVSD